MTQNEILEVARQTGVLAGYEGEPSLFVIFAKALMDVEREACAKLCEAEWEVYGYNADPRDCADVIRARGSSFAATSND